MGRGDQASFQAGRYGNEIDRDVVFIKLNSGVVFYMLHQNAFDFPSGHVMGMDNPLLRMTAFATQVQVRFNTG